MLSTFALDNNEHGFTDIEALDGLEHILGGANGNSVHLLNASTLL